MTQAPRWTTRSFELLTLALFGAAHGCSPFGGGAFICATDDQCTGASAGHCEANGFCSFDDPSCDPPRRYGESSGGVANTCVGGGGGVDAGSDIDAMPDGVTEACFGTGLVRECYPVAPTGTMQVTDSTTIDTDVSARCAKPVGESPWCVIVAGTIQIDAGGTLTATGARPLVFIASEAITINGAIDVASHRGGQLGPAADVAGCNAAQPITTGGGGGAGGSFGGVGGIGDSVGGTGGTPGASVTVTELRGGCTGQLGGGGSGTATPGGAGGGAVYLIAGSTIVVTGSINASGAGAIGGANNAGAGGGGGGSGGFIGLEAPTVSIAGSVWANGGGGGEGSGTGGTTGDVGDDSPNATTAAQGGQGGTSNATDGGDGSVGANLGGGAPTGGGAVAGGGGGGGAGIIRVLPGPPAVAGDVSPPPS